jgi:AcrR family transcriptional regulator
MALREQKKAALRALIVRTAAHLFLKRGYDAVGMEEIASASMCSRSTLNRYFGTKEDVLFPAVPEVVDGLRRALEVAGVGGNPWATARRAVTAQLGQFFENFEPEVRSTILHLWFTEPGPRRRYLEVAHEFEQIVLAYFTAGLADDPDVQLQAQVHAAAMISALRAILHAAIRTGDDIDTLAAKAYGSLESGLPIPDLFTRRDGNGAAGR